MQQNFASFGLLWFARYHSGVTPSKCGEIYDMDFVANLKENTTVKKKLKSCQHLSKL